MEKPAPVDGRRRAGALRRDLKTGSDQNDKIKNSRVDPREFFISKSLPVRGNTARCGPVSFFSNMQEGADHRLLSLSLHLQ